VRITRGLFINSSQFKEAKQNIDKSLLRYNSALTDLGLNIGISHFEAGRAMNDVLQHVSGQVNEITSHMKTMSLSTLCPLTMANISGCKSIPWLAFVLDARHNARKDFEFASSGFNHQIGYLVWTNSILGTQTSTLKTRQISCGFRVPRAMGNPFSQPISRKPFDSLSQFPPLLRFFSAKSWKGCPPHMTSFEHSVVNCRRFLIRSAQRSNAHGTRIAA
jgi:hypothetical protein